MQYSVLNKLNIVHSTNNIYGSIDYVRQLYVNAKYLPTEFLENQDNWEEELMNEKYKEGQYILSNIVTTKLYEKIKKDIGFIFSNIVFKVELLNIWTLILNPLTKNNTVIINPPKDITKYNFDLIKPNTIKLEPIISTKIKSSIPELKLTLNILNNPKIFNIGEKNSSNALSKIEIIINSNIINKIIQEENIYIITTDSKLKYWAKKFPNSFILTELDDDILYMICPYDKDNSSKKMVIFDYVLTEEIINKKRFNSLIKSSMSIFLLTDDYDVINSGIINDFNYFMLYSFPEKWSVKDSESLIKYLPVLKNHKELINLHIECVSNNNSLVIHKNNLYQF